jgi:hypothetical protein
MAPEKHQQSAKRRKTIPKSRNGGTTNGVTARNTHIPSASGNEPSLHQPSSSHHYADISAHRNTPTHIQHQAFTNETFQSHPQVFIIPDPTGRTYEPTPMERWQIETMQEQPWYAVSGVSHHDERYMDADQQDIILSDDGAAAIALAYAEK